VSSLLFACLISCTGSPAPMNASISSPVYSMSMSIIIPSLNVLFYGMNVLRVRFIRNGWLRNSFAEATVLNFMSNL
jgi:hypothetical protein